MTRHRLRPILAGVVVAAALAVSVPAMSRPLYEPGFGHAAQAWEAGRFDEARRIFERLGAKGDPRAQYYLGFMNANGQGGARDVAAAADWYRRAARQDHAAAAYNLAGLLMQGGNGLARDVEEAMHWYQVAAEGGLAQAANNLGILLQQGKAGEADPEAAFTWFRRAAEQAYPPAVYNVAVAYATGQGVARDYGLALTWMLAAAQLGFDSAEEAAEQLARLLDDETAATARQRVTPLLQSLRAPE